MSKPFYVIATINLVIFRESFVRKTFFKCTDEMQAKELANKLQTLDMVEDGKSVLMPVVAAAEACIVYEASVKSSNFYDIAIVTEKPDNTYKEASPDFLQTMLDM